MSDAEHDRPNVPLDLVAPAEEVIGLVDEEDRVTPLSRVEHPGEVLLRLAYLLRHDLL